MCFSLEFKWSLELFHKLGFVFTFLQTHCFFNYVFPRGRSEKCAETARHSGKPCTTTLNRLKDGHPTIRRPSVRFSPTREMCVEAGDSPVLLRNPRAHCWVNVQRRKWRDLPLLGMLQLSVAADKLCLQKEAYVTALNLALLLLQESSGWSFALRPLRSTVYSNRVALHYTS